MDDGEVNSNERVSDDDAWRAYSTYVRTYACVLRDDTRSLHDNPYRHQLTPLSSLFGLFFLFPLLPFLSRLGLFNKSLFKQKSYDKMDRPRSLSGPHLSLLVSPYGLLSVLGALGVHNHIPYLT